jgi:hypothetical protein
MFNLEKAIEEWRKQMLAAGVKMPVPMEELENHLRDDLERQMQSGVEADHAFQIAVSRLGHAGALKKEFVKNTNFWTTNHILGILWGAGCLLSFYTVCQMPTPGFPDISEAPHDINQLYRAFSASPSLSLYNMNAFFLYAAGVVGSVFLFRGAKWGRSIIRMLALVMAIACVVQLFNFRLNPEWRVWCAVVMVFSVVSIWLLHRPEKMASAH